MAWFPIVASVVGTVVQFAGSMKAASAAKQQGEYQQQADKFKADQMEVQAGQEIAASQRAAADQRRQASLVASRAVAAAGAGGGGISDPTVVNLIGDIQGEGQYRSALKLYQGEDSARSLRMGASAANYEGDMAVINAENQASAYRTKGLGAVASGANSLFGKYGMGGPGATQSALTGNGWQDAGTSGSGAFA